MNSWIVSLAKHSINWTMTAIIILNNPMPRFKLQHQPNWVTNRAPGRWIIRDGTMATKILHTICARPDNNKNWPPIAMVLEMMQQATAQRIIDRIWKESAIRKNRTNFFVRWSDTRDERDVKCEATSRIGSWNNFQCKMNNNIKFSIIVICFYQIF